MAIVISLILIFMGIAVLVLIHVCIVGRTLRRGFNNESNNNINMVDRGSLGSTSMSQDDIEKLPCFSFTVKEKGTTTTTSPPPDCAVCLESFQTGEKCRLLPLCNHSFHAECVDLWLMRAPVCPICRAAAELIMQSGDNNSFGGNVAEMGDGQIRETSPGYDVGIQVEESSTISGETGDRQMLGIGGNDYHQENQTILGETASGDRG